MQDGLLLIDKKGGMTSHDVVGACRRCFGRKDIGHAGTLDPMATGLLVVLVGKATKLSDYILNGDKAYRTTILLGVQTDTDDITGEIVARSSSVDLKEAEIRDAVEKLSGELELKVPIYSAIKVKGKKLMDRARKGETFEPPVRKMTFKNLKILSIEPDRVTVEFQCSKGSYVRAWGKALGEALGCGATVETLRRVHSMPYSVEKALDFDSLPELSPEEIADHSGWVPLNQTLPDWPLVKIQGPDEKLICNGQIPRKLERFLELEYGKTQGLPGVKIVSRRSNRLVALLTHIPPLSFKIRRVFPNAQL